MLAAGIYAPDRNCKHILNISNSSFHVTTEFTPLCNRKAHFRWYQIAVIPPGGGKVRVSVEFEVHPDTELYCDYDWRCHVFLRGKLIEIGEQCVRVSPTFIPRPLQPFDILLVVSLIVMRLLLLIVLTYVLF